MKTPLLSTRSRWSVLLLGIALAILAVSGLRSVQAAECPSLLRHSFPDLSTGKPQDLCQYQGRVILVVNTASYCGFTDQYRGLETLYRKYRDRGLVVLGFPANDFAGQEPGSDQQIARFCRLTYGVAFPMFAKSHVTGRQRNAFYDELARRTGEAPRWNFHKYLIDRDGTRVQSFASSVPPDDPRLVEALQRLLDARKNLKRTT